MQIPNVNLNEYNQRVVLKLTFNNKEDMQKIYDALSDMVDECISNTNNHPRVERYREIDEEQVEFANARVLIEAQATD